MLQKTYSFTAIILALQFFVGSAYSQIIPENGIIKKPIVSYNGISNFSLATRNQTTGFEQQTLPDTTTTNRYEKKYAAANNTQLYIKANKKTRLGTKYGAITKLESEFSSDQNRGRVDVNEAFAFAKSSWGEVQIGNVVAVNQKMKVGPASFARGNGGINGNYLKYVNLPALNNMSGDSNIKLPHFIVVAQSPIGHGGYAQGFYNNDFNKNRLRTVRSKSFKGAEDALKMNYFSPRIHGVKFGASYTYDTSEKGLATTIYGNQGTTVRDVVSFGANYSDSIDNLGYAVSLTAENGSTKGYANTVKRNNLSSYDTAVTVVYFGFTLGASYGSWGSSLQEKDGQGMYACDYNASLSIAQQDCSSNGKNFGNASYYTLGGSYEFGPFGISLTSLKSNFQKNEYQAISLDIDYKFKRDLIPYFEITKYAFKSNQPDASDISSSQIQDNKGFVALAGFLFSF